ncbi:MAG: hypothetical protein EOP37_03415 [Rubrivivax sp.]|nr:MAG: hypothetical protein EOP37_03415 [Rubrivivax sp.]
MVSEKSCIRSWSRSAATWCQAVSSAEPASAARVPKLSDAVVARSGSPSPSPSPSPTTSAPVSRPARLRKGTADKWAGPSGNRALKIDAVSGPRASRSAPPVIDSRRCRA